MGYTWYLKHLGRRRYNRLIIALFEVKVVRPNTLKLSTGWYMEGKCFYTSLWLQLLQVPRRTTRSRSFFLKEHHSDLSLYARHILTFSACRWVDYMQHISSRCTSISALAFAAGAPAGENQSCTLLHILVHLWAPVLSEPGKPRWSWLLWFLLQRKEEPLSELSLKPWNAKQPQ